MSAMSAPFDPVLALLPAKARPAAKAYVALAGGVLAVTLPMIPVVPAWVGIVLAVLTGLGVYRQDNATTQESAVAAAIAAGVPVALQIKESGMGVAEAFRGVDGAHGVAIFPPSSSEDGGEGFRGFGLGQAPTGPDDDEDGPRHRH